MDVTKSQTAAASADTAAGATEARRPRRQAGGARRPAWLPAEFDSPEALVAAYHELLAERSGAKIGGPRSGAPIDFEAYEREFNDGGALSDDSYAALEASGLPRMVVDRYIDGQKAIAERMRRDLLDEVGGEDGFAALRAWAEAELSEEALAAYERAMQGDFEQALLAIRGMRAAYERANGRPAQLVTGQARGQGGERFRSLQDLADAMADPRYNRDEAYRQAIQAKLSRSRLG